MEMKAYARNIRMSERKVRLVAGLVRGMAVTPALAQLSVSPKAAARPVRKLLQSAIANAEHNFRVKKDGLFIKAITVDEAASIDRWRPRAFGRAAPIVKHMCHINLVLDSKEEVKPLEAKKEEGTEEKTDEKKTEKKSVTRSPRAKKAAEPAQE